MFLIDSNIIVYSYLPEYEYLRNIFFQNAVFVSEISRVEVLGYHKLQSKEEAYFKDIFDFIPAITPTQQIFDAAIVIRKKHNLKLGDSLIAATASVHSLSIYTRNVKDFESIDNLNYVNPIHK